MKLLCLSNGHGEDVIAVRILVQLQRAAPGLKIAALPIVGEGYAYSSLGIPLLGKVQKMPSGGFIYMDGKQLWQDLQGGLLQLTLAQLQAIRQWVRDNPGGTILAVGDIVPLIFAWLSGTRYAFVGTAKSEYYLRDEGGWLPKTSFLERWFGSVYQPWERWLMSQSYCLAVFPRDTLTTKILQQWSIPAADLGNPMMDFLSPIESDSLSGQRETNSLKILLLPGSRLPEAERNWRTILQALLGIIATFVDRPLIFLAAIAPNLSLRAFTQSLDSTGWQPKILDLQPAPIPDPSALAYQQGNVTLILSQNSYEQSLLTAQVAIAMAGTATEQFVGLGKPAITIPGSGPQFTHAFAEAQTRLLGISVTMVETPQEVATALQSLLNNSSKLQLISRNGQQRLGQAGAARRIADYLLRELA